MMSSPGSDPVMNLFGEFTQLRQSGTNRDDAWYDVLEKAEKNNLSEKQVKRLLFLAKGWEKREGFQYQYRTRSDSQSTLVNVVPTPTESVIRPLPPRPVSQPTTMLNPDVVKEYEELARQQTQNPLRRVESPKVATVDTTQLQDLQASEEPAHPSVFGKTTKVVMYFQDYPDELVIDVPHKKEVIIGRATPNSAMSPDIDLSRFNAGIYGVSRMHAVLERRDSTLVIADLGSVNHTFLNGERLHPNEVRVLRDGDQISFAKMLTQIHFR